MLSAAHISKTKDYLFNRWQMIASARRSNSYGGYSPSMLSLGLTDRCNNQCTYCSASIGPDGRSVMSEDTVRYSLNVDGSFDSVVLTGGEPSTQPGKLFFAVDAADRAGFALMSIQTNALMPQEQANSFFWALANSVGSRSIRLLQLNVSYDLQRSAKQDELFFGFLEAFVRSDLRARIFVETLIDRDVAEWQAVFETRMGQRLDTLAPFFTHANGKSFHLEPSWPLMVGRARALRQTEFGAVIRHNKEFMPFTAYRELENPGYGIIAVDPHGFIYPCGLYMYMGIYPIGHLDTHTISMAVREANRDPILSMIHSGQAEQVFELAGKLNPDFRGLQAECADPFEVFADILADPELNLQLLELVAEHLS